MICFYFNDTATTEIYTLSLHDALPISAEAIRASICAPLPPALRAAYEPSITAAHARLGETAFAAAWAERSEEHTSELQSRQYLVCRLLLEKKKKMTHTRDRKSNHLKYL